MLLRPRVRFLMLSALLFAFGTPLFAQAESDLVVQKSGPPTSAAGADVTWSVSVTNIGPDPSATVTLVDSVPPGMTFVSATQDSGPPFICTTPAGGGTGDITCTAATMQVGETANFSFTMNIAGDALPGTTFTNVATATTATDPTDENNSGTAGTTVPSNTADVAVTKTGPNAAAPDSDVTYTITVVNSGPASAQNVTLTDTLPGTMVFVSLAQPGGVSCTTPAVGAGGTITCSTATMTVGTNLTFTLTGHIPAGTPVGTEFQNTATVTVANDALEENNQSTTGLIVDSADVAVSKTGPATATAGSNATYTLTISNFGPDMATGVSMTDVLPPGTTFVSLSPVSGPAAICSTPSPGFGGTILCSIDLFAPAANTVLSLVLNVGGSSSITNTATVTTNSFDPDGNNNSASVTTTITPVADLAVVKSGPGTATAGGNLTYTITASNAGPSTATGVTLSDTLPPGTTFVSITQTSGAPFNCTGGATVTCTAASFASGASAVFSLTVAVSPASTGVISNTATIASGVSDPDGANNNSNVGVNVAATPDVAVVKSGPASAAVGTDVTYTITVTNSGPSDAAALTLADSVPVQTTFQAFTQNSGPAFTCGTPAVGGTGNVTCTIATFPVGVTATFAMTVRVNPAATGTVSNTATVAAAGDPAAANNTSTVTTTVVTPDVSVVKGGPASAAAGSDVTYTITVNNASPANATSITLTDAVPAQTTFQSFTQNSGPLFTCGTPAVGGTGNVTCTSASLAAGATATFTMIVRVAPAATGTVVNTATVAVAGDQVPANNTSSVNTAIVENADVSVTKSGSASVASGTNATYTVTVTNNGPSTATNVVVSEVVPAEATFVSMTQASGPAFTCTPAGGTATCTAATLLSGASATFTVVLATNAAATGSLTNTATVSASTVDPAPGNNSSSAITTLTPGATDLSVTKTAGASAGAPGTPVTYTVVVTNNGPAVAFNVVVTDPLPAGMSALSTTTTQGTCSGTTTVTCNVGTMTIGSSATITITALLPALPGNVSNTATATMDNQNLNPAGGASGAAAINVAPGATIPTLSTWMLIAMAMMLGGIAVLRR